MHVPEGVNDLSGVKTAIMEWEERWKRMMAELGTDAKIPYLWRMSALLEICPKELKEQVLIRLDEIGEDYEALKNKVISYAMNKVEQFKGNGPTPMEVDNVGVPRRGLGGGDRRGLGRHPVLRMRRIWTHGEGVPEQGAQRRKGQG